MRSRIAGLSVAALVLVVLGAGCNPDRNKLLFKPEVGSKRSVDTEDAMSYSMKMMGMDMGLGFSRKSSLELETQSVDPAGVATIKVTYKSLRIDVNGLEGILGGGMRGMPGRPGAGQAANDDPMGMKSVAAALKTAEGQSFTVKVNKLGEVTEVSGADAIAEKAASGMKEPAGPAGTQSKEVIRNVLGDDALKNTLKTVFLQRPDKALKSAASWQDKKTTDAGIAKVVLDETVTVKERSAGIASLDNSTQLTFEMAGSEFAEMTKKMNLKFDLSGQGAGTAKVDEATGWVKEWLSSAQIKGNLSMQMPGGNGNLSIPIEGSYKLTVTNLPS